MVTPYCCYQGQHDEVVFGTVVESKPDLIVIEGFTLGEVVAHPKRYSLHKEHRGRNARPTWHYIPEYEYLHLLEHQQAIVDHTIND